MKTYERYMDRQTVSPSLHNKLLAMEQEVPVRHSHGKWQRAAVLAACLCLVAGIGWFSGHMGMGSMTGGTADSAASDTMSVEDTSGAAAQTTAGNGTAAELWEEAAEDQAESETEDWVVAAEEPGEAFAEKTADELSDGEAAPVLPEGAVLPGWLPEGYTLTATEAGEDWYSLTWTNGDGDEITVEYGLGTLDTADVIYPVFPAGTAREEAAGALQEIEGRWGFFLEYDGYWRCFITTGGVKELWQVAESFE